MFSWERAGAGEGLIPPLRQITVDLRGSYQYPRRRNLCLLSQFLSVIVWSPRLRPAMSRIWLTSRTMKFARSSKAMRHCKSHTRTPRERSSANSAAAVSGASLAKFRSWLSRKKAMCSGCVHSGFISSVNRTPPFCRKWWHDGCGDLSPPRSVSEGCNARK